MAKSHNCEGKRLWLVGFASILAMSVSSTAARAQAQTAASDDIIVTARKQNERVSDVPVAIQAFSSKDIQRYATQSFSALSGQVPGLIIGEGSSASNVNINLRGIGSGTGAITVDQAVSINLDGLQVSRGNLLRLGFHDMERVEVLKGPQALFYGKNSPGGVVSLISKNPGDEFEAMVRAGYEFYAKQKFVEGMVSGPIAEGLGLRIVGYVSDQDGWFRNISPFASQDNVGDRRDYFVRGTLRYDRSTGFDNTLKISYGQSSSDTGVGGPGQLVYCPTGRAALTPSPTATFNCKLDRYTNNGDGGPAIRPFNPLGGDGRPFHTQKQLAVINSANLEVGDELTLSSVSTYYKGREASRDNFSYSEDAYVFGANRNHGRQFTQEVRATSSYDGPVNFMAGGYYQNDKIYSRYPASIDIGAAFVGVPSQTYGLLVDNAFVQKTDAYSVFGQLTFKLAPKLDFEIGGRYSHEKKKVSGEAVTASIFNPVAGPLTFPTPQSSFDNFSPQATLRYKPSNDLMLYATYRQGFISGGYGLTLSSNVPPYGQETVKGGELGAKGSLLDRQLRFDIAAYDYKYKGLQLAAYDPTTFSQVITNAASAKSYGVDFSTQLSPRATPGFSLRGAVAWNHSRYQNYKTAGCYTGQTPAEGCTIDPVLGAVQDLSGTQLLRAPNWSGNVGATYERTLANQMVVSLSADEAYRGSYDPLVQQNPFVRQNSSWLLNATVSVRAENNSWDVALIGRNLTNTLRLTDASEVSGTGGGSGTAGGFRSDIVGIPTEPRAVMLQVTLRNNLLSR